jgi:hypothetical protein
MFVDGISILRVAAAAAAAGANGNSDTYIQ